ncbi:MAG: hypothetical protein WDO71_14035 [Bacteroidota bacterium]
MTHSTPMYFDLMVKKSTLLLQSGTPGFEYYRSDLGKKHSFHWFTITLPVQKNKQRNGQMKD